MIGDVSLNTQTHPSEVEDQLFKIQAQKLSMMLASEGVFVRTYATGLPFFSKLSLEAKRKANHALGSYLQLCREQMSEGYTLRDGSSFLWRALRKLELVPRSDLFQHFNEDSVIEIYSDDNRQLFRNINFFKYCSYTIEELHACEWWLLFERDPSVTEKLYGYVSEVMNETVKGNIMMDVPTHTVKELQSVDMLEVEVDFRIMSPLTHAKSVCAFLVSEDVRIISSGAGGAA